MFFEIGGIQNIDEKHVSGQIVIVCRFGYAPNKGSVPDANPVYGYMMPAKIPPAPFHVISSEKNGSRETVFLCKRDIEAVKPPCGVNFAGGVIKYFCRDLIYFQNVIIFQFLPPVKSLYP